MSSAGGDRDASKVAMLLRYVARLIDCEEPGGKNADISELPDGKPAVFVLAFYTQQFMFPISR